MIALSRLALTLAACGGLAACQKESVEPRVPPVAAPKEAPETVVATVSVPSLTAATAALRGYAEEVRPGAGAAMTDATAAAGLARMIGATSLEALDLAAPLHLVAVDGAGGGVVLVGKAVPGKPAPARAEVDLEIVGDVALLGPTSAVAAVAGWAPGALAASEVDSTAVAHVWVARLMARHQDKLAVARAQIAAIGALSGQGPLIAEYFDGMLGVGRDVDRAVVTLQVSPVTASVDLALVPRDGSKLAGFVAAQQPSNFDLLGRLPAADDMGMLFVGRLGLGPYRDGLMSIFARVMNTGDPAAFGAAFGQLAELMTGEVAAAARMGAGGMEMAEVFPVSDGAATDRQLAALVTQLRGGITSEAAGVKTTVVGVPELGRHGDVVIRGTRTTVDLSTVPAAQKGALEQMYGPGGQEMQVAVAENTMVVTMSRTAGAMGRAIDALRGKGGRFVVPPTAARLLDDARARRESVVMLFDLPSFMAGMRAAFGAGAAPATPAPSYGMTVAVGGQGGALHLRLAVLSESIRSMLLGLVPPMQQVAPATP